MLAASSSRAARVLATSRASSSRSVLLSSALSSRVPAPRSASTASQSVSTSSDYAHDNGGSGKRYQSPQRCSKRDNNKPKQASTSANGADARQHRRSTHKHGKALDQHRTKSKNEETTGAKSGDEPTAHSRTNSHKFQSRSVVQRNQSVRGQTVASKLIEKLKLPNDAKLLSHHPPNISGSQESQAHKEDPLASVQNQLRAFFSRRTGSESDPVSENPGSHSLQSGPSLEATRNDAAKGKTGSTDPQAINADVSTSTAAPVASAPGAEVEDASASPRTFSRPTLSDLQKAELDQFAGLYQSETVWDPSKDYALMRDGPRTTSFLETALSQGPRQYIVVILDADNLLFDPRHLRKGYDGGKFVYTELRERIAKKHQLVPHLLDLRIRIFCALPALATVLNAVGVVHKELLFDFLQGITDCNLHNYAVNVGRRSQAADLRVKAALADAILDPGCFRAYLGGLDDFGYIEELGTIQQRGLLETKVNLIQVPGFAVESNAYREYAHRAIDLDYLFKSNRAAMREMQKHYQDAASTSSEVSGVMDAIARATAGKPCVFHHLSKNGCVQGSQCNYSHDEISQAQKERLRLRLKQRKCPVIARGDLCIFGDECLFGH